MTDQQQQTIDFSITLGDDALILGQRLSEWCYHAPFLEEDLAMANVALDFIGRANMFYQYASDLEGGKRSADDIAFLRDSRDFKNLLIFELPNGDFANTIVRQLLVDQFNVLYLEALQQSQDAQLAAIAAKSIKESRYHLRRSRDWTLRLGDGTDESHQRAQTALDDLWGYTDELFVMTELETALLDAGISVDKAALREAWLNAVTVVLDEATLTRPEDNWVATGGRQGTHTEYHGHLLSDMQFLQRAYPGQQW